ncbi:mitotic-spindle organizing gamma-tubulin ring associated-domain-containing protein [Gaertneriomyces semiglobifer]|nr:mitotic-spindle organizing gamma-tubulin ring associated-domain-containing protein [Gaertneriomyces semiglobifer]
MDAQKKSASETLDILHEISLILNTGLDRESLALCVSLCENGANPEALAAVIKELKRESRAIHELLAQEAASGTENLAEAAGRVM